MKKYALAAAVAAMALGGSELRADFQYNLIYNPGVAAFGSFPGGDSWTLQVKNNGANGTGTNLSIAGVTMLSLNSNGTVNQSGTFYIRTFNGTSYDTTTPANNNQADFMNQGVTGRPGPSLSYVNFGTTSAGVTTPSENSQTYTDLQAVPWSSGVPNYGTGTQGYGGNFDVALSTAGASSNVGVNDQNFTTLAQAVVPHGQQVTFDMLLSNENGGVAVTKVLSALPGDANFDGAVNGADFAALVAGFGHTGTTWANGDFNGDGTVNGADFATLVAFFGHSMTIPPSIAAAISPSFAAVPEPSTIGIASLVVGLLGTRRRRRP